jgi:intracellular septation protein
MNGLGYTLRYFLADLAAMILFFVVVLVTGNIYLATSLGVALGLAQLAWTLIRRQPVGMLQWTSLGLIVVFGGATLLTHDPRFIMFKPTVVHAVIGSTMLKRGWMERYTPAEHRAIIRPLLNRFGYVWAGLMFLIAALNLAAMLFLDQAGWAKFNLFGDPVLIAGLFIAQNSYMRSKAAEKHYDLSQGAPPV